MSFKTIYYRGFLSSCNYRCGYCPFCKSSSKEELIKDEQALLRFCTELDKWSDADKLTIMFLPYGEALIHNYYIEALSTLSSKTYIEKISCQTNLSFSVDKLITQVKKADGDTSKIKLWCSFHPSQVSVERFASQCQQLIDNGIEFCVGSVGDYNNIKVLKELRKQLPANIYMWVNYMDGKKGKYTDVEINDFLSIDPLFLLETRAYKADTASCTAGRASVFVEGNGDMYACNISKVKIGNIYTNAYTLQAEFSKSNICKSGTCSCYLAYSNRTDIAALGVFNQNKAIRIPNRNIQTIFFDIDGTLTDCSNTIPQKNIDTIRDIAQYCRVFLATSLPYTYAYKRCKDIWQYLSGGAFAQGSDIRIFDTNYSKVIPLDEELLEMTQGYGRIRQYRENNVLHKIAVISPTSLNIFDVQFALHGYSLVFEDNVVGITAPQTDKLSGVLDICNQLQLNKQEVMTVGNSDNDIPMLEHFTHSAAVPDAKPVVRKAAKYISSIENLLLILSEKQESKSLQ